MNSKQLAFYSSLRHCGIPPCFSSFFLQSQLAETASDGLTFRAREECSMRRTLALTVILAMAALWAGCGKSETADNANTAGDGVTGQSQTVSNSNMAPTGGPGPEPENAGSVGKGGNENKGSASNSNKKK
jgi:hypothetical protein